MRASYFANAAPFRSVPLRVGTCFVLRVLRLLRVLRVLRSPGAADWSAFKCMCEILKVIIAGPSEVVRSFV